MAQSTVADKLKVHPNTVGNWENDIYAVPAERRRELERLLGLEPGYLDDFEDPLTPLRVVQHEVQQIRKNTEEILSLLRPRKRRS